MSRNEKKRDKRKKKNELKLKNRGIDDKKRKM